MLLVGEVSKVIHRKPDSGWSVFLLRTAEGTNLTVVGIFLDLQEDMALSLEGDWDSHPRYGKQFKVTRYKIVPPVTDKGMMRYLEWALPHIGPVRSSLLVQKFGADTFTVLSERWGEITAIPGITEERAQEIHESWMAGEPKRAAAAYLAQFGLTQAMAERILLYFGDDVVTILREDPYVLIEVVGMSFGKVDQIALATGVAPNSPVRRRAAVLYCLKSSVFLGHTYLTLRELQTSIADLSLPLLDTDSWPTREVKEYLDTLEEWCFITQEEGRIYLRSMYLYEVASACALREILGRPVGYMDLLAPPDSADYLDINELLSGAEGSGEQGKIPSSLVGRLFSDDVIEEFLLDYQGSHGIEFSENQRQAVFLANQHRVFLLTGLPGTGKTTVLKAILALYQKARLSVQLCAPTGKAAKRLSQVAGREASTLHRYLKGFGDNWGINSDNPAPHDALIVDEFSMVDIRLMYRLLNALPSYKYLAMVGDPGQLPSVGPGSVLQDLITSGVIPRVHLEEIFRQAAQSRIVLNAHRIHKGESIQEDENSTDFLIYWRDTPEASVEYLQSVCTKFRDKGIPFQVLSPKRNDFVGTIVLNEALKPVLNPNMRMKPHVEWGGRKFHLDDKVIMTKNDYKKMVFNGDTGVVVAVNQEARNLHVVFEGVEALEEDDSFSGPSWICFQGDEINNLDLAYALTVHKSQGSEWNTVILLVLDAHGQTLKRRLLYTAVTRAKVRLILIGQSRAVCKAILNNRDNSRNTTLARFLQMPWDEVSQRLESLNASSLPGRSQVPAEASGVGSDSPSA